MVLWIILGMQCVLGFHGKLIAIPYFDLIRIIRFHGAPSILNHILTIKFPFLGCTSPGLPYRTDDLDVSYNLWPSFSSSSVCGDDQPLLLFTHLLFHPLILRLFQWLFLGFGPKRAFSLSVFCKHLFHSNLCNLRIVFSARPPCTLPCCIITYECFPPCFECFHFVIFCVCTLQRINDPDHARHALVLPLPSRQTFRG